MAAAPISTATIARGAQLVGFAVVAGALAVVSWRDKSLNLPDVGQFAGVVGSGFLGGIINPLLKNLSRTVTTTVTGEGTTQGTAAGPGGAAQPSASAEQVVQTVEAVQGKAASALGAKSDLLWDAAVVIGALAIVAAALALAVNGDKHVNAAAALTALATAFGALFVDTSKITHTPVVGVGTPGQNG